MIALPRNADIWLPGLLRQHGRSLRRRQSLRGGHVMFAIADHYEPLNGAGSRAQADRRVERWHGGGRVNGRRTRDADDERRSTRSSIRPSNTTPATSNGSPTSWNVAAERSRSISIMTVIRPRICAAPLSTSRLFCTTDMGCSASTLTDRPPTASCTATGRSTTRGRTAATVA